MLNLNTAYYFGQIKPEHRGNIALFIEMPERLPALFNSVGLDKERLISFTEEDLKSPMRAYLGVNIMVERILSKKMMSESYDGNVFDLDREIVIPEFVERRIKEISGLELRTIN